MRRIIKGLMAAVVMAALLASMAMPALAAGGPPNFLPGQTSKAAEQEQSPIGPCVPLVGCEFGIFGR